jgi:hypothetical protein
MSFRIKKYRLTCSKIGCTYHKILPLYSSRDQYLLTDNSTISTDYFSVEGWCETCDAYQKIFWPKSIEQIKVEIFDIENRYKNSGFLGFGKVKSQKDIELWNLNYQILDVLRRRKKNINCCYKCKGTIFHIWGVETFLNYKINHPKCGGIFKIEEGEILIGSNLAYAGTSFKGWETETREEYLNSRKAKGNGRLLDPDDKVIAFL